MLITFKEHEENEVFKDINELIDRGAYIESDTGYRSDGTRVIGITGLMGNKTGIENPSVTIIEI